MHTATIADLRNRFPAVFRWIQEGETVRLTWRGKFVARLVPEPDSKPIPFSSPDFTALRREILGEGRKVHTSLILEERIGMDR